MNRNDPWDWSTPFKLDTQLQSLTSQITPVGGQGNTQAPPPVAPYSSPFQQAMTNRAMNAGFKKVDTEYDKAFPSKPEVPSAPHDPSKVPVDERSFNTPPPEPAAPSTQVSAPLSGGPEMSTELAAQGGGSELLAAGAQAQALFEEQLAAAAATEGSSLLATLASTAQYAAA